MYFCRSCFEGAALYPRQDGAFFECCLCSRKYTPEEVRGPFSVVEGGSGNVLQRGRPFDLQDRCLNPLCDSVTWAFVDDPAPGRTHRKCRECSEDWPEVSYTADRCFWCHDTRTIERTRNGKTRLECLGCRREWLHPNAPKPLLTKPAEKSECRPACAKRLSTLDLYDMAAGYEPVKASPEIWSYGAYPSPWDRWCPDDPSHAPLPTPRGW